MADRFEQARQIAARYWQGIGTAITAVVAVVALFYDRSKWPIAVASTLAVIVFLRFPRIAVRLTRWILGPPPKTENPPRIFRGPLPYLVGESLPARQAEVGQCWLLLQKNPFFMLEGESGCGKSSILASALLPRAREIFTVVECRVESDPLGRLAAALQGEPYRRAEKETTTAKLRAAIAAAGAPPKKTEENPQKPLLISIDQFEELFVTARDEKRRSLITVLRDTIEAVEARVLIVIRSDFRDLLLGLCREVDPAGSVLDLGSYLDLKAFSAKQARAALGEMLAPLHGDDPLKRQPLEDFSEHLVEELLRPPRDRRLSREDEKTVLPVELQMVGLMLEAVGVEVFTADAIRQKGGKAGLLREYIEDAKNFVWRRTGISGDQALLILRKLISPARTKWPQTAASISSDLGLRPAEVELVLEAFADRFLVKILPADEAGHTRYELMHEHLVQVLVEAPQPILQRARDAEERLRFWEDRATATFAGTREKRWTRMFAQPIPLLEALRLRRFAKTPAAQEILRRNLRAFGARLGIALLPLILTFGVWEIWRRSDEYQIKRAVNEAASSVDALADNDDREDVATVARWAEALYLAGRADEAGSGWQKMKDASARSASQASAVLYLVRAGRLDDAIFLSDRLLREKEFVWEDAWEKAISELMEAAARASRDEPILTALEAIGNTEHRLKSLGAAAEALARAGKTRKAAEVFWHAHSLMPNLQVEQRAQTLLDLAARARRSQLLEESIRFLRGAVVASRNAKDPAESLFASAKALEESGEIDQALNVLREGILAAGSSWSFGWDEKIVQISVAAAKAGRYSDIVLFAREDWKISFSHYAHYDFLAALICISHQDDILSELASLEPKSRLKVLRLAVQQMTLEKRNLETRALLEEAVKLLPQNSEIGRSVSWDEVPFLEAAADLRDSALLGKISELVDARRSDSWPGDHSASSLMIIARGDRSDVALRSAWSIKAEDVRLFSVSSIIGAAAGGAIKNLDNHLNRLMLEFRAATDLPDHVLDRVSLALARGGRVQAARDVATSIKDGHGRVLAEIATVFASSGRFDAALHIADELQADRILRSQALASIIVESANRRDSRSLTLLPKVEYPSDISRSRSAIAKWQARSGEFSATRAMAESCSPADKLAAYTELVIEYALKEGRIPGRELFSTGSPESRTGG